MPLIKFGVDVKVAPVKVEPIEVKIAPVAVTASGIGLTSKPQSEDESDRLIKSLQWGIPALAATFLGIVLSAIGIAGSVTAAYSTLYDKSVPNARSNLVGYYDHVVTAVAQVAAAGGVLLIIGLAFALAAALLKPKHPQLLAWTAYILMVLACGLGIWAVWQSITIL